MTQTFTIASWNVNSVRMRAPLVERWLRDHAVDVLLLQELKALEEQCPVSLFEEAGYNSAIFGQKSWNGVAILARQPLEDVRLGLHDDGRAEEARYIEAVTPFGDSMIRVASVYVPNGNPMDGPSFAKKRAFMENLAHRWQQLAALEEVCVLAGDYNILNDERDCWNDLEKWRNDALGAVEAQQWYRQLLYGGLTDALRHCHDEGGLYSFWNYKGGSVQSDRGLLIDRFLLSPQATEHLRDVTIDKDPRHAEKASDHTVLVCHLNVP